MSKRTTLTRPPQRPAAPPVAPPLAAPVAPPPAPMAAPPPAPDPANMGVPVPDFSDAPMEMPPPPPPVDSEATVVLGPVPEQMPDSGPYLDDAWVSKLPYLAERLGVPAGATMQGASFVLDLDDGRSFDLFLMGHRALDLIQQSVGVSQQALNAAEQIMNNQRQLQQQLLHLGGRIAEVEKKLGITPKLGPVPAPPGTPPRGTIGQKKS